MKRNMQRFLWIFMFFDISHGFFLAQEHTLNKTSAEAKIHTVNDMKLMCQENKNKNINKIDNQTQESKNKETDGAKTAITVFMNKIGAFYAPNSTETKIDQKKL